MRLLSGKCSAAGMSRKLAVLQRQHQQAIKVRDKGELRLQVVSVWTLVCALIAHPIRLEADIKQTAREAAHASAELLLPVPSERAVRILTLGVADSLRVTVVGQPVTTDSAGDWLVWSGTYSSLKGTPPIPITLPTP